MKKTDNKKKGWIRLKKANIKLFSTFLGAAFLFLLLTKLSQDYTQEISLRVELSNLEDELVIVNDSMPTLNLTLKSKGFSLLKFIFNNNRAVTINASEALFKKNKSLFWDVKNQTYKLKQYLGESVEILDVKPDTVEFNFDVLASKMVPVVLNKSITFSDGYDVLNDFELSKDSVKIIGSKNVLDNISVVETNFFELKNVNEKISTSLEIKSIDGVELIPQKVDFNAEVIRFTEGKMTLPINIINVPVNKRVNIFPKQVDLIFYVDIINFKNVKPEDFKLICDFEDIKDNSQSKLDIKLLSSSQFVKRTRLLQENVEFIISDN